jgi:hypothetical protein
MDTVHNAITEPVHRAPWRGVHVTVVSTISSLPPMIADELRREADVFTDLKSKIARDPSDRAAPREPRYHAPQFLQRAPKPCGAPARTGRAGQGDFRLCFFVKSTCDELSRPGLYFLSGNVS